MFFSLNDTYSSRILESNCFSKQSDINFGNSSIECNRSIDGIIV